MTGRRFKKKPLCGLRSIQRKTLSRLFYYIILLSLETKTAKKGKYMRIFLNLIKLLLILYAMDYITIKVESIIVKCGQPKISPAYSISE